MLYGGHEDCERKILGVGCDEAPQPQEFPIALIMIKPRGARFAKPLEHRDVLGSLIGLGIEREVIGDIVAREDGAYVFCMERMAHYIISSLEKVGNVFVKCEEAPRVEGELRKCVEMRVQVSSVRLDSVVARLFNLSRTQAQELFNKRKIAVDDVICEKCDHVLKDGEVISVRGYGRALFKRVEGQSKKGKQNLLIDLYS